MKKLLNFILLATVFFAGCKKDDARYPFDVELKRVPYVNVTINTTGSPAINLLNLASFQGKYSVNLLYPSDAPPSKVDVVIIKNGVKSSLKLIQAGVTTFPTDFTITAAQLATLFGAPIALGDNYDIGVDIYTADGTKYEAFPNVNSTVVPYGATGQAAQPGFTPTARFSAICAYDPDLYQGNFVVVSDGFQDLAPGTVIVLTKLSNTSFSMTYPNPNVSPTSPIPTFTVVVNTGNNSITVAKQQVGTKIYGIYDKPNVQATSGNVAPCDKRVTLNITYTVDQGSFGTFALVLRKP